MAVIQSICVYCGSQEGENPAYTKAARMLGALIAENGLRLVYGGGTSGIMGNISSQVRENGGKVISIIPRFLLTRQGLDKITENDPDAIITQNMHQRKHAMFENADAFVALPGGIGTLEEIVEIMTWAQLGRHNKPILLVNIEGFWDPMIALLDHMRTEGFLHSEHLMRLLVVTDASQVVAKLFETVNSANQA